MSELRSKCCGAEVKEPYYCRALHPGGDKVRKRYWECSKCHKPCEVEEKEESASKDWDSARDAYSGERREEGE